MWEWTPLARPTSANNDQVWCWHFCGKKCRFLKGTLFALFIGRKIIPIQHEVAVKELRANSEHIKVTNGYPNCKNIWNSANAKCFPELCNKKSIKKCNEIVVNADNHLKICYIRLECYIFLKIFIDIWKDNKCMVADLSYIRNSK